MITSHREKKTPYIQRKPSVDDSSFWQKDPNWNQVDNLNDTNKTRWLKKWSRNKEKPTPNVDVNCVRMFCRFHHKFGDLCLYVILLYQIKDKLYHSKNIFSSSKYVFTQSHRTLSTSLFVWKCHRTPETFRQITCDCFT